MENTMKTYKTIEHLRARAIRNNGKRVMIWDDWGITVGGKIFRQMEYGNKGNNFSGNSYVIFRNTGKKGKQPTYANRENFSDLDSFITIEYKLNNGYLFEFVDLEIDLAKELS